jgi:hypothetical protein
MPRASSIVPLEYVPVTAEPAQPPAPAPSPAPAPPPPPPRDLERGLVLSNIDMEVPILEARLHPATSLLEGLYLQGRHPDGREAGALDQRAFDEGGRTSSGLFHWEGLHREEHDNGPPPSVASNALDDWRPLLGGSEHRTQAPSVISSLLADRVVQKVTHEPAELAKIPASAFTSGRDLSHLLGQPAFLSATGRGSSAASRLSEPAAQPRAPMSAWQPSWHPTDAELTSEPTSAPWQRDLSNFVVTPTAVPAPWRHALPEAPAPAPAAWEYASHPPTASSRLAQLLAEDDTEAAPPTAASSRAVDARMLAVLGRAPGEGPPHLATEVPAPAPWPAPKEADARGNREPAPWPAPKEADDARGSREDEIMGTLSLSEYRQLHGAKESARRAR